MKYFYEDAPQYHIACAGSLLGIALHEGTSFPVGKVDFLSLYLLSFREFLMAMEGERFAELLDQRDFQIVTAFKEAYTIMIQPSSPSENIEEGIIPEPTDAFRDSTYGLIVSAFNRPGSRFATFLRYFRYLE